LGRKGCALGRRVWARAGPRERRIATPAGSRLSGVRWASGVLPRVDPLRNLLDHLAVEGGDVARVATGDEAIVDHHLAVDPAGAGVLEVGPQRRVRRHLAVADDVGLDEEPGR